MALKKTSLSIILMISMLAGTTAINVEVADVRLLTSSTPAASTQIWEKYIGSNVWNPPVIADVDNDTIAEFVFGAMDGMIYALNSEDGSTLWSFDTGCNLELSPQVADVDQDDLLEVIIEGESFQAPDNDTFAFNGEDGSIVWANSAVMYNHGTFILTDLDDNNEWEIVRSDGSAIDIYSANNGSLICSDSVTESVRGIEVFNVTADGSLEIVTIGQELNNNVLRIYSYDNQSLELLNITYFDTAYGEYRYIDYADVTNDTIPEYILSGYNDLAVYENGTYSRLWYYSWDPEDGIVIATPSIGDLNGDSMPEIVVGLLEDVFAFDGETGEVLWTQYVYGQVSSQEVPLPLADFDDDDSYEVLVASENNHVYVLDGEDGWFIWDQATGGSMLRPILFDVTGDGIPEIVGWNYNQYFYVFTVEDVVRTAPVTSTTTTTSSTTTGADILDPMILFAFAGSGLAIVPLVVYLYFRKFRPGMMISEDDVSEEDETIDFTQPVVVKGLQALRGGEMVGNRFRFKTKLVNTSKYVITEITVSILSYPRESLKLDGDVTRLFSKIDPNGFRSPGFEFLPTQDCVQGEIVASISFMDYEGNAQSMTTRPYTIRAVCDLLTPESISPDDFALKLSNLEHGDTVLHVKDWTPEEMETKTSAILRSSNFHEVSTTQSKVGETLEIRVNGWASGKYTGKKIGVEITITGKSQEYGAKCKVVVSGEEEAMILPAIDEISQKLGAWLCPRCSGALPRESVKELKAGKSTSCPFCQVTIDR